MPSGLPVLPELLHHVLRYAAIGLTPPRALRPEAPSGTACRDERRGELDPLSSMAAGCVPDGAAHLPGHWPPRARTATGRGTRKPMMAWPVS